MPDLEWDYGSLLRGPPVNPVGNKRAGHGDQESSDQITNSPPENSVKDHKQSDGPYDSTKYRSEEEYQECYGASGNVHGRRLVVRSGLSVRGLLNGEKDLGAPFGGIGFCAGVGEVDFPGCAGGLEALGANPFEES